LLLPCRWVDIYMWLLEPHEGLDIPVIIDFVE
jgi:hypothetical protein